MPTIISASRRTDIPAFYSEWFINRVRAGYCAVPNPFNRRQITRVSLLPRDVHVIVFWTRNARPLSGYLDELDRIGMRYYFQYTVMDNPRVLDPKTPPLSAALDAFGALSQHVGPTRVIWRYDPIVLSAKTDVDFHVETHARIARQLRGVTQRCVVSVVDAYRKAQGRLRTIAERGLEVITIEDPGDPSLDHLMTSLASTAHQNDMEIVSCAETVNLQSYGIRPGKCVDDEYIREVFAVDVTHKKDPGQREECGCVASKDIGMYDSCLFGCQYCYATSSFDRARANHARHNPQSPSLIGWYEPPESAPSQTAPDGALDASDSDEAHQLHLW